MRRVDCIDDSPMNKPSWGTDARASTWERMKEALRRDRDQTNHVLSLGERELNETDAIEHATDAVVARDGR